jgi:hypothetical protein
MVFVGGVWLLKQEFEGGGAEILIGTASLTHPCCLRDQREPGKLQGRIG